MNSVTKVNVAIVGAGPSGIGVALGLAKCGIQSVLLIDRNEKVGGLPLIYKKKPGGIRTFINYVRGRVVFGEDYAAWLNDKLSRTDVQVWLGSKVLDIEPADKQITLVNSEKGKVRIAANAIILACGARENSPGEMGWMHGSRPGRLFFSKSILELSNHIDTSPMKQPVIIGSDLNAYAAAAKLKTMGASNGIILDTRQRPKSPFTSRLYFRRWGSSPDFRGGIKTVRCTGRRTVTSIELENGTVLACDGVVLCGDLIPNSELALLSHMKVEIPSRKPVVDSNYQLSTKGWFASGNMLGGFHGAEWCYLNGLKVAKKVVAQMAEK